jgi:hypothetical protein
LGSIGLLLLRAAGDDSALAGASHISISVTVVAVGAAPESGGRCLSLVLDCLGMGVVATHELADRARVGADQRANRSANRNMCMASFVVSIRVMVARYIGPTGSCATPLICCGEPCLWSKIHSFGWKVFLRNS